MAPPVHEDRTPHRGVADETTTQTSSGAAGASNDGGPYPQDMERRFAKLEARADVTDGRFDRLENKIDQVIEGISAFRAEVKAEFAHVRAETRTQISEVRTELKSDIAQLNAKMERQNGELRTEIERQSGELRTEIERQSGELRAHMERQNGNLIAKIELQSGRIDGLLTKRDARNYMLAGLSLAALVYALALTGAAYLARPSNPVPPTTSAPAPSFTFNFPGELVESQKKP